MDANGNGVLEESEIPEQRRRMIAGIAERLGLEVKGGSIAISKIREAMMRRYSPDRQGKETSGKSADEPEPLVPGFGVEQELARVPAFGERVEFASLISSGSSSEGSSSRSSRSSRSSSSRSDSDRESRMRGFAQYMLRRYDRNRSGALEKEEWRDMRTDPSPADRNNDGVITLDELTTRLVDRSRGRSDESGRGSSGSHGSGSSESNGRKSYRFLTATERLLEGLPDWFARNDANGDGQVAMAEYSSYWSDAKAREFARYDLNHDGLITQRECLDAPTASEGPAAPAGGPSEGPKEEGGSTAWWLE